MTILAVVLIVAGLATTCRAVARGFKCVIGFDIAGFGKVMVVTAISGTLILAGFSLLGINLLSLLSK